MSSTQIVSKDGKYIADVNSSNELLCSVTISSVVLGAGVAHIGSVDIDNNITLNALPTGSNTIGVVNIGTMPNVTLNALPAGTNNIGDVDVLTLPDGTKTFSENQTKVPKSATYTTAQTDTTLWDPTTGERFNLTDILVSVDSDITVTIKDGSNIIRIYYLIANGGVVENLISEYVSTAINNNLTITTVGAGNCFIAVSGYETT